MRRVVILFLFGSGMTFAQSALPATSPTVVPAATPASATTAARTAATAPTHAAKVSYVQGQLQVTANNSSLNQILREISRLFGMTVDGGVDDQRVFGNYGPAPPTDILTLLLEGTGTNMMLVNNSSNVPAELILTPRRGGPTPPNPNAPGFNDSADSGDDSPRPVQPNQPPAGGPPGLLNRAGGQSRFGAMPAQDPSNGSAATGTDSGTNPDGTPSSPNGVQTPQQIYEQLQRLQLAQPRQ